MGCFDRRVFFCDSLLWDEDMHNQATLKRKHFCPCHDKQCFIPMPGESAKPGRKARPEPNEMAIPYVLQRRPGRYSPGADEWGAAEDFRDLVRSQFPVLSGWHFQIGREWKSAAVPVSRLWKSLDLRWRGLPLGPDDLVSAASFRMVN